MGFQVGDDPGHVAENRRRVAAALGFVGGALVTGRQVHGTAVQPVGEKKDRTDNRNPKSRPEVDGFVTSATGLLLTIKIADCFPVFLYDVARGAIGLLHAGWRGTAQGIVENGIQTMASMFGTQPKDLVAGVGPGINKCCFEVKEDVVYAFSGNPWFSNALWDRVDRERYRFDLKQAIVLCLKACGVSESAVSVAGQCTSCSCDLLFSHRRDGGRTGRMAALLGLRR
jgi:YfiH family protein